jgi:hypothetical protein
LIIFFILAFMWSTVTDGITIGHPTCGVHDCDIPLESQKHRFCPKHKSETNICVVTSCSSAVDKGHRTCSIPEHRKLEEYNAVHNKAMFQLKHRLARLKTSQPTEAIPDTAAQSLNAVTTLDDEEILIDQDGICDGKPDKGNKAVRARFGRRRTHNEELCVMSCGVIIGRATFYGSEAPNGVRVRQYMILLIIVILNR